jgi:hypothetical protein
MSTTYAQKQAPAQKKETTTASSVLDNSPQNEGLQRKADLTSQKTLQCYNAEPWFINNHTCFPHPTTRLRAWQKSKLRRVPFNSVLTDISFNRILNCWNRVNRKFLKIHHVPSWNANLNRKMIRKGFCTVWCVKYNRLHHPWMYHIGNHFDGADANNTRVKNYHYL